MLKLGVQFSKRAGVPAPELWLQGLGRAENKSERKRIAEAIREWADGDSIASHVGFGIDLFCSENHGKSTAPSILSEANRKWLRDDFGVRFVTLAELADLITS